MQQKKIGRIDGPNNLPIAQFQQEKKKTNNWTIEKIQLAPKKKETKEEKGMKLEDPKNKKLARRSKVSVQLEHPAKKISMIHPHVDVLELNTHHHTLVSIEERILLKQGVFGTYLISTLPFPTIVVVAKSEIQQWVRELIESISSWDWDLQETNLWEL